jgi:hypothetical protein
LLYNNVERFGGKFSVIDVISSKEYNNEGPLDQMDTKLQSKKFNTQIYKESCNFVLG